VAQWSNNSVQPGTYPPPPPPPRRNTRLIALIASLVVLVVVVVVVGIVVVVLAIRRNVDRNDAESTPASATAEAPAAPLDTCLVGNWKQTQYTATFDLSGVSAGGKALDAVKVSGAGRTWKIVADGTATEDFSQARYTGTTADGRPVVLSFTGENDWTLKTENHRILFVSTGSTVEMVVSVNGKQAVKTNVQPQNNPQPYTCGPNAWTTTSPTDASASTTFTRV
jgi:heme/copper-type cytochrome/quinol oxidase subunit 2